VNPRGANTRTPSSYSSTGASSEALDAVTRARRVVCVARGARAAMARDAEATTVRANMLRQKVSRDRSSMGADVSRAMDGGTPVSDAGASTASFAAHGHTVGRAAMASARADEAEVRFIDGGANDARVAEARARARETLGETFLRPSQRPAVDARESTENDEALARALQEEEDAAARERAAASVDARASMEASTRADGGACCGCGKTFAESERRGAVRACGETWHPTCLRCGACGESLLSSSTFFGRAAMGGVMVGEPGSARQVYHARCYAERCRPKCAVCSSFIPSSGGYVRYHTNAYWGEMYCPEHAADGTAKCDGCGRYEKRGGGAAAYVALPDDRRLCLECVQTVVVDREDAQPLYTDIIDFFGTFGLSALGASGERPPLYLCTQDVINNVDEEEAWHRGRTAQVRGMCVSHVEVVSSVYRQPTWRPANTGSVFDIFGHIDVVQHRIPRSATQKVTAIIILSCLPRMLSGQILAHECMHMFLRLNGFPTLEPIVEEGLCQLFALLWVERQTSAANVSDGDAAFGAYLAQSIRDDPTEIYGDGARLAIAAFTAHGLPALLDIVKSTHNFPSR